MQIKISTLRAGFQPTRTTHIARRPIIMAGANVEQLKTAKGMVQKLMADTFANPLMIRIAWHDAGSFSKVCISPLAMP
jgi:hypothetical protein